MPRSDFRKEPFSSGRQAAPSNSSCSCWLCLSPVAAEVCSLTIRPFWTARCLGFPSMPLVRLSQVDFKTQDHQAGSSPSLRLQPAFRASPAGRERRSGAACHAHSAAFTTSFLYHRKCHHGNQNHSSKWGLEGRVSFLMSTAPLTPLAQSFENGPRLQPKAP